MRTFSLRSIAPWILTAFLLAITVVCLGSAFRDNDQAMLIYGGRELAAGHVSLFRTDFYNYDKQWGTYWLLAAMFRLFPGMDSVLAGNLMQVILLLAGSLLAMFVAMRRGRRPLWILLPLLLSPALVLYIPFLATASLSLGFLFLAFAALRKMKRPAASYVAWAAVFCAAACRGDVVLAVPILLLAGTPRSGLWALLKRPRFALFGIAAIAPVLMGRFMDTNRESNWAGVVFYPLMFSGFVTFALGLGALVVLVVLVYSRVCFAVRKPRWRVFYGLELVALLIPIVFYWTQLFSPRYFFLTLAALLFAAASRRTGVVLPGIPRVIRVAAVALAVVPWIAGIRMPQRHDAKPVWSRPTLFPTADGSFPMGAFAAFAIDLGTRDHFDVDHNQSTWESAKSVNYRVCGDGRVPIVATAMRDYLLLAVEMQGKRPQFIGKVSDSACGSAYVDVRSIIRKEIDPARLGAADLRIVSQRPELGRPILMADRSRAPSSETAMFWEFRRVLNGLDARLFESAKSGTGQLKMQPGTTYYFLSGREQCGELPGNAELIRVPGAEHVCFEWRGRRETGIAPAALPGITAWARTIFPRYIGR